MNSVRLSFRDPSAGAISAWDVYDRENGEHLGYVEQEPVVEYHQHHELGGTTWRPRQVRSWQAFLPDGTIATLSPDSHRSGAVADLQAAVEGSI